MDAAVKGLTVSTGTKFDATGRGFTVTKYTYFVGANGPYTDTYWPGEDTTATVQANIQKRVDHLRALGAIPTGGY